jgi:hypothetical protein
MLNFAVNAPVEHACEHEAGMMLQAPPHDSPQHHAPIARPLVAHPWFYPAEPPVIVALGGWTDINALQALLQAFSQVRSQHPTHMIVLGEIPARPTIEAMIDQHQIEPWIALPGLVNNAIDYLSNADVNVMFNHSPTPRSRWPMFCRQGCGNGWRSIKHAFAVLPGGMMQLCQRRRNQVELDPIARHPLGQSMITAKAPQHLAQAIAAVLAEPNHQTIHQQRLAARDQTGLAQTIGLPSIGLPSKG